MNLNGKYRKKCGIILFGQHMTKWDTSHWKKLKKLCEDYWFPNMRSYVENYIASCIQCAYYKAPKSRQEGFLNSIEKGNVPFYTIHMDHLGPFVRSATGKRYIIVAVEAFTKYTMLYPAKDAGTATVIKFLDKIISQYRAPYRIITDKGTCYTSKSLDKYCRQHGIKHIQKAVSTPRANGQVERPNSTILSALAASTLKENQWDKYLDKIQFSINNTVHGVTKQTPSELLMGYRPRAIADAQLTAEVRVEPQVVSNLNELRDTVSKRITRSQALQKKIFDRYIKSNIKWEKWY